MHLFNLFEEQMMRVAVSRLDESMRRCPRSVGILYVNPARPRIFDRAQEFELYKSVHHDLIYRSRMRELARKAALSGEQPCLR